MLHTFIVGMGRAGEQLHLPSLSKVRVASPGLLGIAPVIVFDPHRQPADAPGVVAVRSLQEAAGRLPPCHTVVHLCTPPQVRSSMLGRLAELGYRKIIVEKPLAVDLVGLATVARLRRRWSLEITVAAHWLDSDLTRRLRTAVDSGRYGRLQSIRVVQNKPRFTRTITAPHHPTAFDVEVPHALPVVLSLAGGARVADASWEDMVADRVRSPNLGRARLRLDHHSGVRTEIDSDLTSPVRERRITLEFERATLVGHYPCSEADHTSQLRTVTTDGDATWSVFHDDALPAFLRGAYRRYAGSVPAQEALSMQVDAVRLLTEAKRLCAAREPSTSRREEAKGVGTLR